MIEVKVGAETEAWCTSCKLMYEHVVVAMVGKRPAKVECAKCHKQHLFRAGPPAPAKVRPPSSSSSAAAGRKASATPLRPAPPPVDLDQLAALTAGREQRAYSPSTSFAAGDVVRHPSFGIGVVVLLPGPQKMEVAFQTGQKLLAHGRGGVAAPALSRPAARLDDDSHRVTDAPPDRPPRT